MDHITVGVSNGVLISHTDKSGSLDLLTIEGELHLERAAKVLPEAGAEAWHGVQVVEAILEFVLASLIEGRLGDVDVATSVQFCVAHEVNDALWAHADVGLYVLSVARVLVRVVREQHVVGLTVNTEWLLVLA